MKIKRRKDGTMMLGSAREVVGQLSDPGKMPGPSWSLSTKVCHVGAKLRGKPGTVCNDCYACRGFYAMPTTVKALARRLRQLKRALRDPAFRDLFVEAFVTLLETEKFMRWHDSGDVISVGHVAIIADVARRTPWVKHWLPTKEAARVTAFVNQGGDVPSNLVIRVSAFLVGDPAPEVPAPLRTSTVHLDRDARVKGHCPAIKKHTTCDGAKCKKCWDPRVPNVSYGVHGKRPTPPGEEAIEAARAAWTKETVAMAV
jgi:hypothetical protein